VEGDEPEKGAIMQSAGGEVRVWVGSWKKREEGKKERRTRREAETVNEVRGNLPKLFRRREDQLTAIVCEVSPVLSSEVEWSAREKGETHLNSPIRLDVSQHLPQSPRTLSSFSSSSLDIFEDIIVPILRDRVEKSGATSVGGVGWRETVMKEEQGETGKGRNVSKTGMTGGALEVRAR
jgi:hypothetical protein